MKRVIIAFLLVTMLAVAASGETGKSKVVASTSWVAAFVRTAGVDDVTVLAPVELTHPPEYELKPSDIATVARAEFIVYAGYENMVGKLKENARKTSVFLAITTQNDPESIHKGVLSIAETFGTQKKAAENLKKIDEFFADWKKELEESGLYGKPILCHSFQKPLAGALDFTIAGVFGPAPPEAKQIADLVAKKTQLIIDNFHNPIAAALSDSIKNSKTIVFINFPTPGTGKDILSILAKNREILNKTLGAAK